MVIAGFFISFFINPSYRTEDEGGILYLMLFITLMSVVYVIIALILYLFYYLCDNGEILNAWALIILLIILNIANNVTISEY